MPSAILIIVAKKNGKSEFFKHFFKKEITLLGLPSGLNFFEGTIDKSIPVKELSKVSIDSTTLPREGSFI